MKLIDQIILVSTCYGQARSLSRSRVSTLVFGEGTKLNAISVHGADLTTARFERAMQWFSANWPESAAWPDGVYRPPVNPVSSEAA